MVQQLTINQSGFHVSHYWIEPVSFALYEKRTIQEWARLLQHAGSLIVLVSEEDEPVGALLPETIVAAISSGETAIEKALESVEVMEIEDSRTPSPDGSKLVLIKEGDDYIGAVTRENWRKAREEYEQKAILEAILENAYEGIVIVDKQGKIVKMNNAYRSFIGGKDEAEVEGKFVADVIENTRLHEVVKSGIPERGEIQRIEGQNMVVHRIPIWENRRVVGAVGMLIFEGVSELYEILQRARVLSEERPSTEPTKQNETSVERRLIGRSEALQSCKCFARKVARTKATVLLTGETGTGKELFARLIHQMSNQANGPFVAINCAAMPETLLEAELFGYEEGAFTGARRGGAVGKFEQASGGTLFLDEAGEMSNALQAKLLRVLETKQVDRVGSCQPIQTDFRLIAATNANLDQLVAEGKFRKDLYYRLVAITLNIPPLRERKEDIPYLISAFMDRFAQEYAMKRKRFCEDALHAFLEYDWPGNVRELANAIDYIMAIGEEEEVTSNTLPPFLQKQAKNESLKAAARRSEKERIEQAIVLANGNKAKAAKLLGIHRATLYRKLKERESS
ncbi:sigma 54-interacting transcriptional regulator [Shouchella clausii]|uniref:sigma-54 interaction domain-containing protein n=1 Tax=Shouchella clausii TaxID=79880 RepID=UPI003983C160